MVALKVYNYQYGNGSCNNDVDDDRYGAVNGNYSDSNSGCGYG